MSWPQQPSEHMPYFGDGETYGDELGRVSPEGNMYGQIRVIRRLVHKLWWNGRNWVDVEVAGNVSSTSELPTEGRIPFGMIIAVIESEDKQQEYFYGENGWEPLKWRWEIQDIGDLPMPGHDVGEAHRVFQHHVPFTWNGYEWIPLLRHSIVEDDENVHLPPGFLSTIIPDVQLVFVSASELTLERVQGGSGRLWVAGEYVEADYNTSVFPDLPVLNWDSQANGLTRTYIEPDTEYWVYAANTKSTEFWVEGLPADETHNEARKWDFRGRLFLSSTPDIDGRLARIAPGRNARLVGKIQSDSTPASEGGPFFVRELDISWVSRTTSFHELHREHSDYRVEFVDESTLRLGKIPGTYGQIYVGQNLYYLGVNYEIGADSTRIVWDSELDVRLSLDSSPLSGNSVYHLYLAAQVDPFNFNEINPDTNRPWRSEDSGAEEHYDSSIDYRLKPFLSEKTPDNGRLAEEWPGFYTRHIGTVRTDGLGNFRYSADLSAIRQPTLNPTYLDGLAEISIQPMNSQEFRICARQGSSGIVLVSGSPVQTYAKTDQLAHKITTADTVYGYSEGTPMAPLVAGDLVSSYVGETLHLYLANERSHWGSLASRTFFSTVAPSAGYLSQNWPGNNARWLASIELDANGEFTGSYVLDSIAPAIPVIDDGNVSPSVVWSGMEIVAQLSKLYAAISASTLFANQQEVGCALKLERKDSGNLILKPTVQETIIAFEDASTREIPDQGITIPVTGNPQTMYYVYLTPTGECFSTLEPDSTYPALHCKGNDILIGYVGLSATNTMAGEWNVFSFWGQSAQEWSTNIVLDTSWPTPPMSEWVWHERVIDLGLPGIVIPPVATAQLARSGITGGKCQTSYLSQTAYPAEPARNRLDGIQIGQMTCNYHGTQWSLYDESCLWEFDIHLDIDGSLCFTSPVTLQTGCYGSITLVNRQRLDIIYPHWSLVNLAWSNSDGGALTLSRQGTT